ncbi:MAG TPA: carbamoyltransferase C-terminal domain-containing protein [Thermoanaerobaculia bacterium]|nr:carbamoyltransferase C-terminal domain-containing protein [Thermoanaerobaculia bacterium]
MRILGLSPLDKDSTVCLAEDGRIVAALAEERLSRQKMHSGFPHLALRELFDRFGVEPASIDRVVYPFFEAAVESDMMRRGYQAHRAREKAFSKAGLFRKFHGLSGRDVVHRQIPGLPAEALYLRKSKAKQQVYRLGSTWRSVGERFADRSYRDWIRRASAEHGTLERELLDGLAGLGLEDKLQRVDHHLSHSANAYYTSGFDEALIVTLDGYGSGLAGSICVGRGGKIQRIHSLPYPVSLGEFYERVTSSLGFRPSRHEGKIVGLAAYGDPEVLSEAVSALFEAGEGELHYHLPHNFLFARHLASRYSKPTVAAAFQRVLERVACEYVGFYVEKTGIRNLALSGGVMANVKANQRLFEIPGVEKIFIHPNMGDGGCCVGAALLLEAGEGGLQPERLRDAYLGPDYSRAEMLAALRDSGLEFDEPTDLERRVAELLAEGRIVARFDGRMEYGPRALGNRSILYQAGDPAVNLWLNVQLRRTEFMPFAPICLYEAREQCFRNLGGAEHAAEFMTITFDCTDWMVEKCPAAVHVDRTARPQLVRREVNPGVHRILEEYARLTGTPVLINTSFNMHEEPIVCTPRDALRAFTLGHLHYLALGPFLVRGTAAPASAG